MQLDDHGRGFRGTVHGIALTDLLQMLHLSRASLGLRIEPVGGVLVFHGGEIVHALAGGLRGREAVREVLSQRCGRFVTEDVPVRGPVTVREPLQALLLDLAREADEVKDPDLLARTTPHMRPERALERAGSGLSSDTPVEHPWWSARACALALAAGGVFAGLVLLSVHALSVVSSARGEVASASMGQGLGRGTAAKGRVGSAELEKRRKSSKPSIQAKREDSGPAHPPASDVRPAWDVSGCVAEPNRRAPPSAPSSPADVVGSVGQRSHTRNQPAGWARLPTVSSRPNRGDRSPPPSDLLDPWGSSR